MKVKILNAMKKNNIVGFKLSDFLSIHYLTFSLSLFELQRF